MSENGGAGVPSKKKKKSNPFQNDGNIRILWNDSNQQQLYSQNPADILNSGSAALH